MSDVRACSALLYIPVETLLVIEFGRSVDGGIADTLGPSNNEDMTRACRVASEDFRRIYACARMLAFSVLGWDILVGW